MNNPNNNNDDDNIQHHQHYQHYTNIAAADLRHFLATNTTVSTATAVPFPSLPFLSLPEFFPPRRLPSPPPPHPFDLLIGGRHVTDIAGLAAIHDSAANADGVAAAAAANDSGVFGGFGGFEGDQISGGGGGGGEVFGGGNVGDGGATTTRWPREETLTLLQIRSRLDDRFKEANQKGPLWDEVSRIMVEEHGYQRSGKKCREKFENLYKYYKKTKEGKAGRQDGKHYRFFRQLEALYGDNNANNSSSSDAHIVTSHHHTHHGSHDQAMFQGMNLPSMFQQNVNAGTSNVFQPTVGLFSGDSLSSLSNSPGFASTSSDDEAIGSMELGGTDMRKKKKGRKRSWKVKIKEFIDTQMRRMIDKQEALLDKMMKTLEQQEKERALWEEQWRRREAERAQREHEFWANERAWIEARDAAIMEALEKLIGSRAMPGASSSTSEDQQRNGCDDEGEGSDRWPEPEMARLIHLRTQMEARFQQCGSLSEEMSLWEEISSRMDSLGYDRSATMCKAKWDSITCLITRRSDKDCKKKRKEIQWRSIENNENILHNVQETNEGRVAMVVAPPSEASPSPHHRGGRDNAIGDGRFRFMVGQGGEYLGKL
ncbi:hypothetical protein Droror1_Dr00026289 [Drosera rotundifolia]